MEYEKCYVFTPGQQDRPAKKRRVGSSGLQSSWPLRQTAHREAWEKQKARIDGRLEGMNAATISQVSAFLDDSVGSTRAKLPTGIILSGPNALAYSTITRQLVSNQTTDRRRLFASLKSTSGSNLKALLKSLIQAALARDALAEDDDDELESTDRRGVKPLNYDLQVLYDYVRERKIAQVVVSFDDTEAFDSSLLSDLVELLGCWLDRIPFVCLFGVATSVEFLQQRLSRAAVACLDGRLFDVTPSGDEVEQVFDAIVTAGTPLWIGPNLASIALERQRDYIQGIGSLVDAIQYASLSCYYANALTVFLIPNIPLERIPKDHFEALRSLVSFRAFVQQQLDEGRAQFVSGLLRSDAALDALCHEKLSQAQAHLASIMIAIGVIRNLQTSIPSTQVLPQSKLYVQAMSGRLGGSPMLRGLLLSIRKSPSDVASAILDGLVGLDLDIPETLITTIVQLTRDLKTLIHAQPADHKPLRSEDDLTKSTTLRTTVVAQKVELSKHKSSLSKQDAAYTALVRRFTDALEAFFESTLIDPRRLPFHEIFLYDLKSPYREVFTPRPRHAVERALSSPHDYLACACCAPRRRPRKNQTAAPDDANDQCHGGAGAEEEEIDDDDDEGATLSATQPATAVLYQLYLESGSLINASDLWQAFNAVMSDDGDNDDKHERRSEEQTMALFQRGLAELKYLGMVKSTRKRVDHVAKVAWRGL